MKKVIWEKLTDLKHKKDFAIGDVFVCNIIMCLTADHFKRNCSDQSLYNYMYLCYTSCLQQAATHEWSPNFVSLTYHVGLLIYAASCKKAQKLRLKSFLPKYNSFDLQNLNSRMESRLASIATNLPLPIHIRWVVQLYIGFLILSLIP